MDHKKATAILSLTGVVITEQSVLKAWKRKVSMCHPDKNQDVNACEATQILNQAKDCMLKALDDGVFAEEAVNELSGIMKEFEQEMEEFKAQAKKNEEECKERMRWFLKRDKSKYLEIEASQLARKTPRMHARIFIKKRLEQTVSGRAILKRIKDMVDTQLEERRDFILLHTQLQQLYRKIYPEATMQEIRGVKYNLTVFVAQRFNNIRHFYYRGQRAYQHIKMKCEDQMINFEGTPKLCDFITVGSRWNKIVINKKKKSKKSEQQAQEIEMTQEPHDQNNSLPVDLEGGGGKVPVARGQADLPVHQGPDQCAVHEAGRGRAEGVVPA